MSRRRWIAGASMVLVAIAVRVWVGAPLGVHTEGMMPGVAAGDVVWVRYRAPRVGEVVRARMDAGEAPQLVRWVAGPGQTVEVSEGVLYVDGMPAAVGQSRRVLRCGGGHSRQALERWLGRDVWVVPGATLAAVRVPAGHGWFMGDQRPEAGDSQRWGPVSLGLIEGVATTVLWPSYRCGGQRWSRLANRIN